MPIVWAKTAWLPDGDAERVRIEIDQTGTIVTVEPGARADGADVLTGFVLPGLPNVHSHAFQRALAGLAERLEPGEASFWSWREVMYRLVERLRPEHVSAIAAQLQVEMLQAGYTTVGEFHYLHHAEDGRAYAHPATLSEAILEAQDRTGIGLTFLPALYVAGGFGGRAPEAGQSRFVHDADGFLRLVEALRPAFRGRTDRRLGIAPHSLRAVPDQALDAVLEGMAQIDPTAPVHIHAAEQLREIRACLDWCGRRPVRHLLERHPVDERWCVIHATHIDDNEIDGLAATGAVVGLCPTTEANLGDGLFPLVPFLDAGGLIGVGSDSHISVNPFEDLRWLEYGQRLQQLRRLVAATTAAPHTGARLLRLAAEGGSRALGRRIGRIAPGYRADLLHLDPEHPTLVGHSGPRRLDALVFSGHPRPIQDVMVGGIWRVRNGRHHDREPIARAYGAVIKQILSDF